jgi:hypothetical protein
MSVALDVGIGVVFLYLLLALMVTTCQELIATTLNLRAKHLYDAIAGMLETAGKGGTSLAQQLYEHPLIRNLVNEELELPGNKPTLAGKGLPSYIPSKTFALALIDVLRKERGLTEVTGADRILASAGEVVTTLPKGRLKDALSILVADAELLGQNVDARSQLVSSRIEGWFNDRMARASGWYKRRAQRLSLMLAFGLTLAFNADTIHAAKGLWSDAGLRLVVTASADEFVKNQPVSAPDPATTPTASLKHHTTQLAQTVGELKSSTIPIGWQNRDWRHFNFFDGLLLAAGWLITALAVSLGAAFWFDVLSRALQLRGSGPKVSASTGVIANGTK